MNEEAVVQMKEDGTPMTLVDYLDQLQLAPEPPAVSMWPQTAGWIWLGLIVLALLVWGLVRWFRHRQESLYRRQALEQITVAGDDPAAIAPILRRTALAAFPRRDVAGLQGDAWLAFLDRTYGGHGFAEGIGSAIVRAPYTDVERTVGLAALASTWVRRHRVPKRVAP